MVMYDYFRMVLCWFKENWIVSVLDKLCTFVHPSLFLVLSLLICLPVFTFLATKIALDGFDFLV